MLLEMLLLNELEEAVCHCFCCALPQGHIVGVSLVAIVVLFQSLRRFSAVLCANAHGSELIARLFIVALVVFAMLCSIACASGYQNRTTPQAYQYKNLIVHQNNARKPRVCLLEMTSPDHVASAKQAMAMTVEASVYGARADALWEVSGSLGPHETDILPIGGAIVLECDFQRNKKHRQQIFFNHARKEGRKVFWEGDPQASELTVRMAAAPADALPTISFKTQSFIGLRREDLDHLNKQLQAVEPPRRDVPTEETRSTVSDTRSKQSCKREAQRNNNPDRVRRDFLKRNGGRHRFALRVAKKSALRISCCWYQSKAMCVGDYGAPTVREFENSDLEAWAKRARVLHIKADADNLIAPISPFARQQRLEVDNLRIERAMAIEKLGRGPIVQDALSAFYTYVCASSSTLDLRNGISSIRVRWSSTSSLSTSTMLTVWSCDERRMYQAIR